jgi:hypothetical protein|uniref:Uncharacterized protein n=1 Tax=Fagus sylvatica TaxID=28930 RepID=A0A2N9HIQ7_FAGSY
MSNNHSISQIFSSQQVKAEQRKAKSEQEQKRKKLTKAHIVHLGCVKHPLGSDPICLLQARSVRHLHEQSNLSSAPIRSVSFKPALVSMCLSSVKPSSALICSPRPDLICLGLGLVLYGPARLLQAISVLIWSSTIQLGSFEPDLPSTAPSNSSTAPICPPRPRFALHGPDLSRLPRFTSVPICLGSLDLSRTRSDLLGISKNSQTRIGLDPICLSSASASIYSASA